MTTFTSLPLERKPRERLRRLGAEQLGLDELLAVILGSGTSGVDVLTLASQVAQQVRRGKSSFQDLLQLPGIGEAKAAEIQAVLYLG